MIRAFATVAGSTMVSRVLGFVRDVLIAANLGTGPVADAFFVAFRFPNLFRRLFAEGAFNSAFIPILAKYYEADKDDLSQTSQARIFARDVMSGLLMVLLIFTILAEIAMPWFMLGFAPGFSEDPEKFDLAVLLTQLTFPYLLLMSLTALLSGVLNTMGKFAVAAAAPILLNIVLITVLSIIGLMGLGGAPEAGILLAIGVTVAGVAQLAMVAFACKQAGFLPRLGKPTLSPDVKRFITLGIPGLIAGGITQVNIFIGTVIASMQASAVSYLYFADRVYQLPLGVIGIAIGIVLLPDLAKKLRGADQAAVDHSQNRALEYAMLLTVPAAIALFIIPAPIVSVLFERFAWTSEDTANTAMALAAFAVGLPAFVLIKVFSPGFFAREDTKTPMHFAFVGMVINVAGSFALFPFLGHVGIAIATTVAGWVNAALLGITLWRRGHYQPDHILTKRLPGIIGASILMGALLWAAIVFGAQFFETDQVFVIKLVALAVVVAAGILTFFGFAQLFGGVDLKEMLQMFRRRGSDGDQTPITSAD